MQPPMSFHSELKHGAFMGLMIIAIPDAAIQLRSAQEQLGEFARVVKATVVSWAVSKRWPSGG
jgi:hypothetical protein